MNLIDGIQSRIKKNKIAFIILAISILSIFAAHVTKNGIGFEIFAWLRLWKYLSFILFFTTLYILFIRGKKVVLANITLLFLLLFLLETSLFFLLGMPSAFKKDFKPAQLDENHLGSKIGTVYYADSVYHDVLINEKDTVFDVHYSIDSFHKRITPDYDSTKNEYSLFFGCSIGFGYGLDDNQTLAASFQKISNTNAYNYSISGTGTNHMLALLQSVDLTKQVKEKNGSAYYIFFWDHIYRSIGSMSRYTDWLSFAPYYTMDGEKLIRKKMFTNGRPFISRIYEEIYQTNIVNYFQLDFPMSLNDWHYNLISEMVLEMKKEYENQFGNDSFYLVFYPSYKAYKDEEMKKFQSFLKKKKIKFIDLSAKIKYTPAHTLGGDAHPNAETNKLVSTYLYNELKQK